MTADEKRREKARNLRYRKPIVKDINLWRIREEVSEMMEECEEVRWYTDTDEETLINALDGNEDEAYEFKMMFADLCAECERMYEDLQQWWLDEDFEKAFDEFFVGIGGKEVGGGLLGWDSYEQDYLRIDYDDFAENDAKKRLMKKKKEDILQTTGMAFKILMAYVGLKGRYDNLKSAMDILKAENTDYLKNIKKIESLYDDLEKNEYWKWGCDTKEFDAYVNALPQEA